jgi:SAM-dependent methyltransferase
VTTPATDPYAAIAEWYDVEHDALTEDVEWLHEALAIGAPAAGGRRHVLEIGAGTGRIAAGLAAAGFEVTAVEPSEAMRSRAAKRLQALPERVARRVRILDGSATALNLDSSARFDAVVFGLGVFAHLITLDERLRALTLARAHLRPGGQLVVDLDLAGLRRLAESPGQLWHQGTWPLPTSVGGVQRYLSHFVTAEPAREPGLVKLTHFYDVHEQSGGVSRTISQMTLALLSRGEIELALSHTGYRITAVLGDYAGEPFEDSTGRALFVATPA